ncbi:MAG: type II toxin-antitoxin system Phd/YefM family antitoxin [Alphaproteobacteria bacterium]|nr:type II toxin-antitoxin system Phd/YefM family antitoxin [Alphaproteobacteria bacterium]
MGTWPVQDAKARFSELLEAAIKEGPQIVTRRGVEAAVLAPIAEWKRLQQGAQPSLKELLLAEAPRFDRPQPTRGRLRRRAPPDFA